MLPTVLLGELLAGVALGAAWPHLTTPPGIASQQVPTTAVVAPVLVPQTGVVPPAVPVAPAAVPAAVPAPAHTPASLPPDARNPFRALTG